MNKQDAVDHMRLCADSAEGMSKLVVFGEAERAARLSQSRAWRFVANYLDSVEFNPPPLPEHAACAVLIYAAAYIVYISIAMRASP